ncbi:MAG: phosphatase PAP2 family protein [Muribaculaceae bacterium]|nr:phosphatase PAP2 family protein [Muribaculaceae bacterium]
MEIQILDQIQGLRDPAGDVFWPMVTRLGNGGHVWILLAVTLLVIPKTRKSGAVLAVALCVELLLCNVILKPMIARTRPFDVNTTVKLLIPGPGGFSFPSGHTAASFTAVAALFFAGEKKLWKPALILAALIAFSRLYLYVHYPTDILGGMAVGVIAGYMGCVIARFCKKLLSS